MSKLAADPASLHALTRPLSVEANTLHVWVYRIEAATELVAYSRSLLSPDERDRADRFVFEKHRTRYTVAHGVMRSIIGRYCDTPPRELAFSTTATGKPALLRHSRDGKLPSFNLSHSDDHALLAVSDGRAIGADLERVRDSIDALAISERFFFGNERRAIESAAPPEQARMFFRYWVAKESVLKAEGIGLGFALEKFGVEFTSETEARVHSSDPGALSPEWTVKLLQADADWAAGVSTRGTGWRVRVETAP